MKAADAAAKIEAVRIACNLARSGHAAAIQWDSVCNDLRLIRDYIVFESAPKQEPRP